MDRDSSKHGPRLDEEMAQETRDVIRSGHNTHTEEWRQPEPTDEMHQSRSLAGGPADELDTGDIETRSLLARALGPGTFPADTRTLRRRAEEVDLPADLTGSIANLPAGHRYANVGDLARALGLKTET